MEIKGSTSKMERIIKEAVVIVEQTLESYKKNYDAEEDFELSREDLLLYYIEGIAVFFEDAFLLEFNNSETKPFEEFVKQVIIVTLLNEGGLGHFGEKEIPWVPRWEISEETGLLEIYVEKYGQTNLR